MMIKKEKTTNFNNIQQIIFLIEQVYFYLSVIFAYSNRNKFVKKKFGTNDCYFFRKKKQNLYRNVLISIISVFHEKKNGNNLKMVRMSEDYHTLMGKEILLLKK